MIGNVIRNRNGRQYLVLQESGKYLLLKNESWAGGYDRYIVAYNLYPDGRAWQHGQYFNDCVEAVTYFSQRTKEVENP